MATLELTEEQQEFVQEVKRSASSSNSFNLTLESCAGSGKTTVIKKAWQALPTDLRRKTKILAFNRSIAEELKIRGYPAQTAHGFGFVNMCRALGAFVKLDSYKIEKMIEDDFGLDRFSKIGMAVSRCVAAAKNMGMRVPHSDNYLIDDTDAGWLAIAQQADAIEYITNFQSVCQAVLAKSSKLPKLIHEIKEFKITFDDMLYLPFLYNFQDHEQNRIIFTDECQDLNNVQISMQCMKGAFTHFFVGDPRQAIYAFRGANLQSYQDIIKLYDCKELKLTESFRCPKNVCSFANGFYGYPLKPHSSIQHTGEVKHIYLEDFDHLGEGVNAYLCMTNAPLIKLVPKLLKLNIPIEVRSDLIGKLKYRFNTKQDYEIRDEIAEGMNYTGKSLHYQDFIECLSFFYYSGEARGLLKRIEKSKDPNKVVLSTIHRAKGLEFDKVCFIKFRAKPRLDQIQNLGWVGCTRTAKKLYLDIT